MVSLPPKVIPAIARTKPPNARLIPVDTITSTFLVTIRVKIPPKAEQIALINNIPSPNDEKFPLLDEPEPRFITNIPVNPIKQPIVFLIVICSLLNIMQAKIIRKKVLKESIMADREPERFESPI